MSELTGHQPDRRGGVEIDHLTRDPASRRSFLKLAGPGAAALFLAGCGTSSDPQKSETDKGESPPVGGGDLPIVKFALGLEYLERDFYTRVVNGSLFKGKDADVFKLILANEQQHVSALEGTVKKLGGKLDPPPRFRFPLDRGPREVLRVAGTLENTGVAAYLGQAPLIENDAVLAKAMSIHSIEARHAAKLNRMLGEQFTPDGPFASPLARDEVLNRIAPFIA